METKTVKQEMDLGIKSDMYKKARLDKSRFSYTCKLHSIDSIVSKA